MILKNQYAGHIKWWRFTWGEDWKPEANDRDWTEWDYILADVAQVIDDYTDSESGQLMWIDQSDYVYWDTRRRESGSVHAIRKEEAKLKPEDYGVSFYAVPVFPENVERPTLTSWLMSQIEDDDPVTAQKRERGRPPTAEELEAMSKPVE